MDEEGERFVVFVGALEVAPFVEGFLQEGVAEGFGVADRVEVEGEPAAVGCEGGAGCEGWDGVAADEEGCGVEAAAHLGGVGFGLVGGCVDVAVLVDVDADGVDADGVAGSHGEGVVLAVVGVDGDEVGFASVTRGGGCGAGLGLELGGPAAAEEGHGTG